MANPLYWGARLPPARSTLQTEPCIRSLSAARKRVHFFLRALDFQAYASITQILYPPGHIVPTGEQECCVAETHPLNPAGIVDRLMAHLFSRRHGGSLDQSVDFFNQ